MITIVNDMSPFDRFIETLSIDIGRALIAIADFMVMYNTTETHVFKVTFDKLKTEIMTLRDNHIDLMTVVADFKTLHNTRHKRSLIPIVGKALSFLFGTVSESDLATIRSNVKTLAKTS